MSGAARSGEGAAQSAESAAAEGSNGHVFVIAAPSGTGKTTLCARILAEDENLVLSVSHTTRAPRAGEQNGVHYHFVEPSEFRPLVDADAFLEHAEYNGNLYGTSFGAIRAPLAEGRDVLLEIEVQGAAQVRERMLDACLIFLLPPSLAVLEARLKGRGTDSDAVIAKRMALVDRELAAAAYFDFAVVNDDLDLAVREVLGVIAAVRAGREAEIEDRHGRAAVLARWQAAQQPG